VFINGRPVNTPSREMQVGDVIAVRETSYKTPSFKNKMKRLDKKNFPKWIDFDVKKGAGTVSMLPTVDDIDHQPQMQLIVEFYSR